MSITDELRKWAHGPDEGDDWLDRIDEFCDRIDAEHEAVVSTACRLAAGLDDDALAKRGYIALPVDADGEYIHVGDVLYGYGKTIEVVELRYGRSGWVLISRDGNGYADTFAFTHYHAPTVEDVLREFADEVKRCCDTQDTIAEYAAKLRLSNSEE